MSGDISGICREHSFESAEAICRRCGSEYCELCLVYPFGASKPLCKECAMAAGGVRSHVSRSARGKRDIRRIVKAFEAHQQNRKAAQAIADGVDAAAPTLRDPLSPIGAEFDRGPAPVPVPVPANGPAVDDLIADRIDDPPPAPPAPAEQPAAGVAPPIDWSQPFG